MYRIRYDDPFVDTTNVVNPLQIVGDVPDQYSLKLSMLNRITRRVQVNVYSGTFVSDLNVRATGFQATAMEVIEAIIQQTLVPDFVMNPTMTLGRPNDYIFNPEDILVSFASKNDYLVFDNTGKVTFFTTSQLPQYYDPNDFGAPPDFTFISSQNVNNTYKVTYPEYGKFTVLVNGTKLLTFDNVTTPMTPVATYGSSDLVETVLMDDTKLYKPETYISIGITVLPSVLPMDQSLLVFAETQPWLFYNGDTVSPATAEGVIDFVSGLYAFTVLQKDYISRIIRVIFRPIVRSLYHILNLRNRGAYSANNGFATFAAYRGVSLEIKLS